MVGVLTQRLKSSGTGMAEASEALSALLQLQADGARSTQDLDPVDLQITTLVGLLGCIKGSQSCCKHAESGMHEGRERGKGFVPKLAMTGSDTMAGCIHDPCTCCRPLVSWAMTALPVPRLCRVGQSRRRWRGA